MIKQILILLTIMIYCSFGSSNVTILLYADDGDNSLLRNSLVTTAKKYIGIQYNYGGTGEKGFDCSGFVHYIYKKHNIIIPRMSFRQYQKGERINLTKALPGDLIFFKINRRKISHVGIYLGDQSFIHSPSSGKSVRISKMTISYWKQRYAGVVTYISKTN